MSRVQGQEEVGLEETFHSSSLSPNSSTLCGSGHQVLTQQGKPSQAVGVANVFKNWKLGNRVETDQAEEFVLTKTRTE